MTMLRAAARKQIAHCDNLSQTEIRSASKGDVSLKPPLKGCGDYIMGYRNMATSIRLDDDFVEEVKVHAEAMSRSVPKQIEYWAKIGRIAEDNPELPFSFINEILLAKSEIDNGRMTKYVRRRDREKS